MEKLLFSYAFLHMLVEASQASFIVDVPNIIGRSWHGRGEKEEIVSEFFQKLNLWRKKKIVLESKKKERINV